jgi:TolB protein
MQKILRFLLLLAAASASMLARADVGYWTGFDVRSEKDRIPVRVTASNSELNALAFHAFEAHGRYRVNSPSPAYDIKFTLVGATQVRVDIEKNPGNTQVASEIVTGTSARNALLKAADVAVVKTNGMGLRGFFASELAFIGERTGHREVYTSDLFFGSARQITHDNADALTPRWSPDGSRLLYTSYYKSGFPDIFQIDLGSYQRTTFASFKGTNIGAHFSPNGQQVAMVLSGTGSTEIWTTNAYGRGPVRRTNSDAVKSSPCFSPDGSRIVFAMEPGPQLYVMSASGGSVTRVTSGVGTYCAEPDWSRVDPNKIAFTVRAGGRYQIAVLDLSTRKSEIVSEAPFDAVEPSWLADGRHLVYTARDRSSSVICILDTVSHQSHPVSARFGPVEQASVLYR